LPALHRSWEGEGEHLAKDLPGAVPFEFPGRSHHGARQHPKPKAVSLPPTLEVAGKEEFLACVDLLAKTARLDPRGATAKNIRTGSELGNPREHVPESKNAEHRRDALGPIERHQRASAAYLATGHSFNRAAQEFSGQKRIGIQEDQPIALCMAGRGIPSPGNLVVRLEDDARAL